MIQNRVALVRFSLGSSMVQIRVGFSSRVKCRSDSCSNLSCFGFENVFGFESVTRQFGSSCSMVNLGQPGQRWNSGFDSSLGLVRSTPVS
ncbi:hypothetical protein Hdeb2414_s0056g00757751 [Helianthus debilis subsp. tardiflorus]